MVLAPSFMVIAELSWKLGNSPPLLAWTIKLGNKLYCLASVNRDVRIFNNTLVVDYNFVSVNSLVTKFLQ